MTSLTSVTPPLDFPASLKEGEDEAGVMVVGRAEGWVKQHLFLASKQTEEGDNSLDLLQSPARHYPHLQERK